MSSSSEPYRGRVQAQGDDIQQEGGYSCSWARKNPVTAKEGLSFLANIKGQCSEFQREERKQASARSVHLKVIVKPARVLKFEFLAERFGEKLTGDPNAPAGVLGPPIPPSTRVKNLRIV